MPETEYHSSILEQLEAAIVVSLASLLISLSLLVFYPTFRSLLPGMASIRGGTSCTGHQIETRCVVCLEAVLCNDAKYRELPECGHGFHAECIDRWMKCRRSCPICRTMVARERPHIRHWLVAAILSGFFKWIDSHFDSELTLVFSQNL